MLFKKPDAAVTVLLKFLPRPDDFYKNLTLLRHHGHI
jgi:hypothetical protein